MKAQIADCKCLRDLFMILKKNMSRASGVFQNVRLVAEDDEIGLIYTDGECCKRLIVDGQVFEEGQIVFDLRSFDKIAKKLKKFGGSLLFESEDKCWVTVTHDRLDFRLKCDAPDDQIPIPDIPQDRVQTISAGRVLRAFKSCAKAISSDQCRKNLTGLYLADDIAVSTDGHRLRKVKIGGEADFGGVIVPGNAIDCVVYALKKLKIDDDDQIIYSVDSDGEHVCLSFDGGSVSARTIDGSFPDYVQVLPKASENPARVNRADFLGGIDLVDPFVPSKTSNVRLTLSDEGLEMYASDPDMGEGKTIVPCDYDRARVKSGYNINYLKEALKDLGCETIELNIIDDLSPTTIIDPDQPDDIWVVMPMRL